MAISILLLGIFCFLLISAAVSDIVSYTIPNWLNAAMSALFFIFIFTVSIEGRAIAWSVLGLHLLGGTVALAAGITIFAAGWIGGGDAKFFAVASLWLGLGAMLHYALVVCIIGGVLAVVMLAFRHIPLSPRFTAWPWVHRLVQSKAGIPYGVALGLGALRVLPETELFRLVVS
jgi:prepilin peptidase CpaA